MSTASYGASPIKRRRATQAEVERRRDSLFEIVAEAFHRLGMRPAVRMYSDYTPVDFTAERLVCGLMEPTAAAVHHLFRPGSVDFTATGPAVEGRAVASVEFMAALRAVAESEQESAAAVLHALLMALPATAPGATTPGWAPSCV